MLRTRVPAVPLAATEADDIIARLAAWTVAQGITAADSPASLAARVIASLGAHRVGQWLDEGGTPYLQATARRYADPGPLTDGQFAAEDYLHGHGGKLCEALGAECPPKPLRVIEDYAQGETVVS